MSVLTFVIVMAASFGPNGTFVQKMVLYPESVPLTLKNAVFGIVRYASMVPATIVFVTWLFKVRATVAVAGPGSPVQPTTVSPRTVVIPSRATCAGAGTL